MALHPPDAPPTTDVAAEPAGARGTLGDLDAEATLSRVEESLTSRRAAQLDELELVAHWAVLHPPLDPAALAELPAWQRPRAVSLGGEGTPDVQESCLVELAFARQLHVHSVRAEMADVLDLQHRLPLTWARVRALECESWVARKVASISRQVPRATVWIVDRAVAAAIGGHSPATVLEIARARSLEADPSGAAEREESKRRRHVALSRTDEDGLRTIIAKVTAGDAAWFDAVVDRVAHILAVQHAPTRGTGSTHQEYRAMAVGWLARPVDLLRLLMDHTFDDAAHSDPVDPEDDVAHAPPFWAARHLPTTVSRLASMSSRQLASLRPRATVFVHLTDVSLRDRAGVARVEGVGPALVTSLADLLGHTDVDVKPVIDLNRRLRVDDYEHPAALKDHVWLLAGGDCFPFAPRTATRDGVDFDHVEAYRFGRPPPPGQTGTHNSGPLRRTHHRWKTHLGHRVRQAGPGRYLWQTPHGRFYLRDHRGTRFLDSATADLIVNAPPGVDVYTDMPLVWAA